MRRRCVTVRPAGPRAGTSHQQTRLAGTPQRSQSALRFVWRSTRGRAHAQGTLALRSALSSTSCLTLGVSDAAVRAPASAPVLAQDANAGQAPPTARQRAGSGTPPSHIDREPSAACCHRAPLCLGLSPSACWCWVLVRGCRCSCLHATRVAPTATTKSGRSTAVN